MQRVVRHFVFTTLAVCVSAAVVLADEPDPPSIDAIRAAIHKAIPLIEKASAGSAEQRTCFTCHSQAVPILSLSAAQQHGFNVDQDNLARQVKHTVKHLERGRKNYLQGKGQGGQVLTAGYALWALQAAGQEPNDLTAAVSGYLLARQSKADHWSQGSQRPPSAGSHFANTFLALRGLNAFGTDKQQTQITARLKRVRTWLLNATPKDTEDRAFRLQALTQVDVEPAVVQQAIKQLLETQQEDGGWAQTSEMQSDAYATGTALVALLRAGKLSGSHASVRRGIQYLLETQREDGTWHVVTRAKGFQEYFETGFPHDEDQFISTAGSAWSLWSLVLALPEKTAPESASSD